MEHGRMIRQRFHDLINFSVAATSCQRLWHLQLHKNDTQKRFQVYFIGILHKTMKETALVRATCFGLKTLMERCSVHWSQPSYTSILTKASKYSFAHSCLVSQEVTLRSRRYTVIPLTGNEKPILDCKDDSIDIPVIRF